MGRLESKTALVTGASSGIGRAIAARFVEEGARVFATGRRQDALDELAAELGSAVTAIRADASNLAELDTLYEAIESAGSRLDIVVANAGGGTFATLENLTPDSFDETFGSNVRGTVFTVKKALPLLNDGGSIIVTGSTSASHAISAFGVYSASKAAIAQFVRVWAMELADRRIRVNTLVPGPTETPGLAGLAATPAESQRLLAGEAARVPLRRLGQPSEIAAGALFLASDDASFVTGSELFLDGGESRA
ncbi:SDR family NAD(P)-dependent oxidoreductase [Mycobacterium sp. URHB0021]|jgi:NAD(P)-dependent dehydrogenase (short-subunit alcohol dehydrogenase family)